MKKAQAAIEFLTTYGWAILVVIVAIGALAYFGLFSPDQVLPSTCITSEGFNCVEYKVQDNGTIYLNIQNNAGIDVNLVLISIKGNNCTNLSSYGKLNSGSSTGLYGYHCVLEGNKIKADIIINYIKAGESVVHTALGSINGKGEK